MQYSFQNDVSRFVANIIPLQNINTNTTGVTEINTLSNSVAALQTMVNVEQKKIFTNFMSAYDTGGTIQVESPMNMSNVPLTVSGQLVSGGGSSSSNQLIQGGTSLTLFDTSIQMNVSAISSLTLNSVGDAVFSGNVYAQQFITLSDMLQKRNIREFDGSVLKGIMTVPVKTFEYENLAKPQLGFLAQEMEEQFPACVEIGPNQSKYINYQAVCGILWKALQEILEKRLV